MTRTPLNLTMRTRRKPAERLRGHAVACVSATLVFALAVGRMSRPARHARRYALERVAPGDALGSLGPIDRMT